MNAQSQKYYFKRSTSEEVFDIEYQSKITECPLDKLLSTSDEQLKNNTV